jgi:hypothetical protein
VGGFGTAATALPGPEARLGRQIDHERLEAGHVEDEHELPLVARHAQDTALILPAAERGGRPHVHPARTEHVRHLVDGEAHGLTVDANEDPLGAVVIVHAREAEPDPEIEDGDHLPAVIGHSSHGVRSVRQLGQRARRDDLLNIADGHRVADVPHHEPDQALPGIRTLLTDGQTRSSSS